MALNNFKHILFKQAFLQGRALILIFFVFIFTIPANAQKLTGVERYDTSLVFVRSPKKASFYSAVLPGLGQIYNKKYWKVPLIYGGSATLVYFIQFNHNKYTFYRNLYIKKVANDPSDLPYLATLYHERTLRSAMDYWAKNRDYCILGLAALYIANIVDATVDAYLFDYDVTQDLSMNIKPVLINSGYSYNFGLNCSFTF